MDEILKRDNFSIKTKVENIIAHPHNYTLDEIEDTYKQVKGDNRLSIQSKSKLTQQLRILRMAIRMK